MMKLTLIILNIKKITFKGSVPESIKELTNLTKLDIDCGKLKSFSKSIEKLTNLTYLSIHNTNLLSLPESIGKLINLTTLNIVSTQF